MDGRGFLVTADVVIVDYGYMILEVDPRNAFIERLFGVLVSDNHAQKGMLQDALFQGWNKRSSGMHVQVVICNLINGSYDKRIVEADVFATDCPAFIGAWG